MEKIKVLKKLKKLKKEKEIDIGTFRSIKTFIKNKIKKDLLYV